MLTPDNVRPCSSCNQIFGRYNVGFRAIFDIDCVRENWLAEGIQVCTLCKRDPIQHLRWIDLYKKNKPWKDDGLPEPTKVELLFNDLLVAHKSE